MKEEKRVGPVERENSPADDIWGIIFTSGSTGGVKGVVQIRGATIFAVEAISNILGYSKDDRVLCCLPFSFDYGLYQIFLAHYAGATLVIFPDTAFPVSLPGFLRQKEVTVFPLVPTLASLLLRSGLLERVALPRLRLVTSTGEHLSRETIKGLGEALPGARVAPMYGLTECKRVSILPPDFLLMKKGSVGKPLDSTRVRIIDEEGVEVEAGERGRLQVSGLHLMGGYWKDPSATAGRWYTDGGGCAGSTPATTFAVTKRVIYTLPEEKAIF